MYVHTLETCITKILNFHMPLDSNIFVVGALIFAAIYLFTLSPSIAGGDSGELVAEGCILGIAHVRFEML